MPQDRAFSLDFDPLPEQLADTWRAAAAVLHVTLGVDVADRIGEFGERMIRNRVRRLSQDASGAPLEPYSDSYDKSGPVDLTESGTMLDELLHERLSGTEMRIYPSEELHPGTTRADGSGGISVAALLGVHHYGRDDGSIPARPVFGFTEPEKALLSATILNLIDADVVEKARRTIRGQ